MIRRADMMLTARIAAGLAAAALLVVPACRRPPERKAAKQRQAPAAGGAVPTVSEGAGGAEDEEAALPEPNPDQQCGGHHLKDEAALRAEIAGLQQTWMEVGRSAALEGFIRGVASLARERSFDDLSEVVDEAMGRLVPAMPEANESHRVLMTDVARSRLAAYAACRSLADRDLSWCAEIEEEAVGRMPCTLMYALYVRLLGEVIEGGSSCEEEMTGFEIPGMDGEDLADACRAVTERKPDRCPGRPEDQVGAMCRALSGPAGGHACDELKASNEEHDEHRRACCEKFAWRFANARNENVHLRFSPERGALSGETAGCERALVWGLLSDLAPAFGVQEAGDADHLERGSGQYLCLYKIHWTTEKLPEERAWASSPGR